MLKLEWELMIFDFWFFIFNISKVQKENRNVGQNSLYPLYRRFCIKSKYFGSDPNAYQEGRAI